MTKSNESVVEHGAVGTQTTSANVSRNWRVERYRELGFTEAGANVLADSLDAEVVIDRKGVPRTWRTPLHWMKVQKALQKGATHAQALELFT